MIRKVSQTFLANCSKLLQSGHYERYTDLYARMYKLNFTHLYTGKIGLSDISCRRIIHNT